MITGQRNDGSKIYPKRLADALFLFNICIEASYNIDKLQGNTSLIKNMNTNILIYIIYNIINYKESNVNKQ